MKIKIIKILALASFLFAPLVSFAETHIYSKDIQMEWNWKKEESPYILEEPIYIPEGHTLTMSEGVEVVSAYVADGEGPHSLTIGGELRAIGSKDSPIRLTDLYSLYFVGARSSISNALLQGTGLDFFESEAVIKDTTIRGSFNAITAQGSRVSVSNSILEKNSYGISSYFIDPIFPMLVQPKASKDVPVDMRQNIIEIHDSKIADNENFGILNQASNTLDATNNWWGNADGPGDTVSGPVLIDPWTKKDPFLASCCSNVLFLPGIQASRLYKGSNMLWEPNRNDDVRKLFTDSQGRSIDPGITTLDIIDSAFGIKDIYASFISSMDGLVDDGLVNEWLPAAYDWRMGAYDVVDAGLLEKAYALASTSKTGKITIIAHSNGGLVAKALMKTLEEKGLSEIVDKSIFVAVPELGTPQAILSMLHGDNQSIAGGLILSENTSRSFSQNLPGAYGLLPSRRFFEKNIISVISDFFSKKSGQSASSYASMGRFLTNNSFSKASSTDTDIPLTLNSYLFSLADAFHTRMDIWKPASTTKTMSIFGWGMPTAKAVNYERDPHCATNARSCEISTFRSITKSGDGTVLTAARSDTADETFFLNLKKIKEDTKMEAEHADILEIPELQSFLEDTITEDDPGAYGKYFTTTEPIDNDKWLYVRVYSPVDIHVYDKNGNHTGLLENPVAGVNLENYEDAIPSSVYDGWGSTKQVILPYDQEYEIVLNGTGSGTFTVRAEVVQADEVIASASFSEMPVTPVMNIGFAVA